MKVRAKVQIIILGQYYPAGTVFEIDDETYEKIDEIAKNVALEPVEDDEDGQDN